MNLSKQKAFNERMGKAKHYPKHQNLSKGGMVDKRKHFDSGGVANNTTQSTAGTNALGTSGGFNGNVFSPGQALYNPQGFTNEVGGVGTGLASAFTAQNQYQAQLAPTTQFDYAPAIQGGQANALNANAVNQAIGAEQGLAGQYGQIAQGQGFNPAIAALNQQTGTNVANTAALQAGQRGGSQNVGLLSRQIGQQGAATQQGAVGQAATLESQQALNALGAQGGLQNQIATQGIGEQGVGANLYSTAAGANTGQNNTNVANYSQAQSLNQATAAANTEATNKTLGGITGGAGSLLSALNKGGEIQKFDGGGGVNGGNPLDIAPMPGATVQPNPGLSLGVNTNPTPDPNQTIAYGALKPMVGDQSAQSFVGKVLEGEKKDKSDDPTGFKSLGSGIGGSISSMASGGKVCPGPHKSHVANYLFATGGITGKVPALVSAKEVYLNPHQVKEVVERGADPMKIGHHFPGKDKVKKDSEKNDVIPVDLDDGGVVIPIHITTHKDASEKGRQFVEKAHAKRYMKKPKGI